MTHAEILLIAGPESRDAELVVAAAEHRPQRVTVLIDGHDPAWRWNERLARLLTTIERATGAIVVGLVGDAGQLEPTDYDAVVRGQPLLRVA